MSYAYRIDIAGGNRPHYCKSADDSAAVRNFLRARKWLFARAGKIKISVYKYQPGVWLWAGIDATKPAEVWDIEPGAFLR